jgi:hypothetical protein
VCWWNKYSGDQTYCNEKEARIKYRVVIYDAPAGTYEVYAKLCEGWNDPPSGLEIFDIGMYIWADENERKIDCAKEAAKIFVDLLKDEDRASIIEFPDPDKYSYDKEKNRKVYYDAEVLCDLISDKRELKDVIDSIEAWGYGTSLGDGIKRAIELLKDEGRKEAIKAIIILTDGYWNEGANPIDQAEIAAEEGIRIYTIGWGSDVNEEDLRKIAEITGGKYYYAATKYDIYEINEELAKNLTAIIAENIVVKIDLNDDMEFVGSSIPPTEDNPALVWNIDELSKDEIWSVNIYVTPTINPTTPTTVKLFDCAEIEYTINGEKRTVKLPDVTITVYPEYPKIVVGDSYETSEGKLLTFDVKVETATQDVEEEPEFYVDALPVGNGKVLVTWLDPAGSVKKYQIYRSDDGVNFELIKTVRKGYHGIWDSVDVTSSEAEYC